MTTLPAIGHDGVRCRPGSSSVGATTARRRGAALVAASILSAGTAGHAGEPPATVSIYAGSRGTGVPAAARARLDEIENYLTGERVAAPGSLRFKRSIVGLEGETLLCIALDDPIVGRAVWTRLQPMVASAPLLGIGRSACSVD